MFPTTFRFVVFRSWLDDVERTGQTVAALEIHAERKSGNASPESAVSGGVIQLGSPASWVSCRTRHCPDDLARRYLAPYVAATSDRQIMDLRHSARPSTVFLAVLGFVAPVLHAQDHDAERAAMVAHIRRQGVRDSVTLTAMHAVPRHEFVPLEHRSRAYGDHPLPIGFGQTISQPYIVAYMTEILGLQPGMKVLEVGTGSGYQAAVLAAAGADVYTIEIFATLADEARDRLARLGYATVQVRHADGHNGWPEAAPFDAVIVTAAAGYIPPALVDQMVPGGRMIIPVGSVYGVQNLILVEKNTEGEIRTRTLLPVRFVPMLAGLR